MRIVAEIPARHGSKRVKEKNLRSINGKPLICYAIDAAKGARLLTEVYVNSESDVIGRIAEENGVRFYRRRPELAEDAALSDEFNYDFVKNVPSDVLVMINTVNPLIRGEDVDGVVRYFLDNAFDTVVTVREERLHSFCEDKPVNFNPDEQLPRTQNIPPVQVCCWSVCVWRTKAFMESFEKKGHAVFCGKVGLYPLSPLRSIKISTEEDFALASALLRGLRP